MKKYIGIIPLAFILIFSWFLYLCGTAFFILFFWIEIPMVVWAVIATVKAYRSRNEVTGKIKLGLAAADVISLSLIFHLPPFLDCDAQEMADHYEVIREDLDSLDSYVRKHTAEGRLVRIELVGKKVKRFSVTDSIGKYVGYYDYFEDNLNSEYSKDNSMKIDSIRQEAGLDEGEFNTIRGMLRKAGCWSIEQDSCYSEILYKQVGPSGYCFRVYTSGYSADEKAEFIKNGEYIPYDDRCVFRFRSGAIGPIGWPSEEKEKFMKSNPKFVLESD